MLLLFFPRTIFATVYSLHNYDTAATIYTTIEGATCGDTVNISSGNYTIANGAVARIYFTGKACGAGNPLTIQAADPNNKPTFDYTGFPLDGTVTPVPGSSPGNAGDHDRGAWQIFTSTYVTIDGIHIKGATAIADDSVAGIRYITVGHFTVRNCILDTNYNGLQGLGVNTLVESNEFVGNGRPGSDQQHQFYEAGGDSVTIRYNWFHNMCPNCGQNLHSRSWHTNIYSNWFQDAAQYEWDMMTPNSAYATPDNAMYENYYGNVVVTSTNPGNTTKVFTFSGDNAGFSSGTMHLDAQWNTFWVRGHLGGGSPPEKTMFQMNDSTTTMGGIYMHYANNVLHFDGNNPGGTYIFSLYNVNGTSTRAVTGDNNWFDSFTASTCAVLTDGCLLTSTVVSASSAAFNNLTTYDLRPANASFPFGTSDATQLLKPPFQMYPGGVGNLSTISDWTDRGALQYSANPSSPTVTSPLARSVSLR